MAFEDYRHLMQITHHDYVVQCQLDLLGYHELSVHFQCILSGLFYFYFPPLQFAAPLHHLRALMKQRPQLFLPVL